MRILECTLYEFGAFKEKTFTFGDGLNIIEGGNESGKSTLLAFIRFMFYGVPRKSASDVVPERDRILSWDGGIASGRMTVETADGVFRIERTMRHVQSGARDTYPETVKIIDTATGEQIHRGEEPGEVFFGVPMHVFESTAAVRQTLCTHLHTAELGSSIENMLFTGDEGLNTQKANAQLDSVRRTLLHKNGKGGRLYELEEEQRTLRERLTRAKMSAAAIVDRGMKIEDLKKQTAQQRMRLAECEETCNNFENLALLRRFAQLHDLEKKTDGLRAQLDQLYRERAHGGYLPDDTYLTDLRSLKTRLRTMREDLEDARMQKEQATREAAVDENIRRRMAHADQLRSAGGFDRVMEQYVARWNAIHQMRKPAVILLVLGVVLAALGVAGLVMAIPMPGAIGLAAGGIFAAAGALCLYLRGRKKGAQTQFLAQYGLSPTCTEKALAGYLEGCETVSRRHALAEDALADATRLLSERERVLGLLCEECVATLARMGVAADAEDTESLYARLDAALTDFSALAVEHERLRREYERLYVNLREIRLELSGQNEAELRAHLTVEQAQKSAGEDIGKLRSERDYLRRSLADADARRSEMEKQLVSLEATAEDPGALSLQLEELEKTLADCRLRHEALVLAGEALAVASTKVRRGVTPRLRSGAGMWMNKLTGGRYEDLGISASMAITVESEGETRPIEAMSGGTVDAAYLSLRLSLLEVLYGVDRPPLLLDESLCQLDDRRAEHFLSMLTGWCAAGSQCLLFTCQSREAKICRDVGYFEHVKLN
jgi:hypothetical protein